MPVWPAASAIDAAAARTRIVESELASTSTVPRASSSAPCRLASTTPSMMLRDSETPIDTATPVWPKAAAIVAAPAKALISEVSVARAEASCTTMREGRAPTVAEAVSTPDCTRTPIWFSAHTPEPLTATPVWPAAIAAEPATTKASMVWRVVADRSRSPLAVMSLSTTRARTVEIASSATLPKPSWPIRLRATDTPIEAPTAVCPAAIATDSAATRAAITASLRALTLTSPCACTVLSSSSASVSPAIELTATAPAPEIAIPVRPMPTAADAATAIALMLVRVTATVSPAFSIR